MKRIIALFLATVLTVSLVACSSEKKEENVIKVGASPAPHAEILEFAKDILAKDGITLEIVEFTDYVLPNTALEEGDIDANYFQHLPYLEQFNNDNGTHIVSIGGIHFEPLGLYPGKTSSVEELKEGGVIAVPSDTANEARSLYLLEGLGLIKLKDGVGLEATPNDIIENKLNLEFYEIEAAQLPNVLPDVDLAVINGNYAVSADLLDLILTSESKDGEGAKTYENILCVKEGNENNENVQKLLEVLKSDEVIDFINTTYKGVFVPMV